MTRTAAGRRRTRRSGELFKRAQDVLVDGVSSPSRGPLNYEPYPIFMDRGEGGFLIDVDGNRYIDLMLAFGALIHGHAHPRLIAVGRRALEKGALTATASEVEIDVAEQIARVHPCVEQVRFANTGTEACMAALRLARGLTGRSKILKFEGHYHGWSDAYSLASNMPGGTWVDSVGITAGAVMDTIVAPWNDAEAAASALEQHRGEVAAIVTEPVMANLGVIPPEPGYLESLRALADEHGALLYIDETVTGFRLGGGGACGRFGIRADLVTFGKALGAGFPVAAIAGPASVMEGLAGGRILHYGTQNANPALLAIVAESLTMLDGPAFTRLDALADRLATGLRAAVADAGTAAVVQHVGPMLQLYFTDGQTDAIRSYRDFAAHVDRARFRAFVHALFDEGVYTSPSPALHSVLSTVHAEEDVDRAVAATRAALDRI